MKQGVIFCLYLLVPLFNSSAQLDSIQYFNENNHRIPEVAEHPDLIENKDLSDVLRTIINSRVLATDTIKEKGKLYSSVLPAVGYSLSTKFIAVIDAKLALYTDKEHCVNMSVIDFSPTITSKHQVIIPIQSNIWSKRNKFNFQGKFIYYKYPEFTYGLGGRTRQNAPDPLIYQFILLRQTVLKNIYKDFYAGIGYDLDYHWGIVESWRHSIAADDFDRYGKTHNSKSSGIMLNALYDTRRNPVNPVGGYYGNVIFRKNNTLLGSDSNWNSLIFDLRSYFKLSDSSKDIIALWTYDNFTLNGKPPYLDLPSTGWDTNASQGRGYNQSRFRGRNLVSVEAEYRFALTSNRLLGGVLFANSQSVSDWPNNRFTRIFPGGGSGVRIKVNKHSDTNLAVDYAFGFYRSRGLFVTLGEVF
jgi:hypothetical protein